MNRTLKVLLALVAVGLLAVGVIALQRARSRPPITVTVRIAVTPPEQSNFVSGQANSARFKYLLGKRAGVKPVLAQQFSIKPMPGSPLLEGQVRVSTKEEAQLYVAGFIETLQLLCATQAQVTLATQSIR